MHTNDLKARFFDEDTKYSICIAHVHSFTPVPVKRYDEMTTADQGRFSCNRLSIILYIFFLKTGERYNGSKSIRTESKKFFFSHAASNLSTHQTTASLKQCRLSQKRELNPLKYLLHVLVFQICNYVMLPILQSISFSLGHAIDQQVFNSCYGYTCHTFGLLIVFWGFLDPSFFKVFMQFF